MLGIEDYGSGSESEDEKRIETTAKSSLLSELPAPSKSKPVSLPNSTTAPVKAKRLKKITIALPSLPSSEIVDDDEPPVKKARTSGAGASSLLSMLPAPKQTNPVPQRVLGGKTGAGLVFNAPGPTTYPTTPATDQNAPTSEQNTTELPPTAFLPLSLAKGKANVSLESDSKVTSTSTPASQKAVDFFSLGTISSTSNPTQHLSSAVPVAKLSAAPEVPTFAPPEPTPTDPYPGYYQLPSGAWAAHDPAYYATFLKKWKDEYDAHVRALEKGTAKGFEGYDDDAAQDVDTQKEMERAKREVKEREERKALTKGAGAGPSEPRMKMTASKMSGIAKTRHQLATLLRDAYQNRDALEERIAEGKRNRKEAGNKYGF